MPAFISPQAPRLLALLIAASLSVACTDSEPPAPVAVPPIADINTVADQYFEDNLQLNPCAGIYFGDYRFNDKYCISSPEKLAAQRELNARYLNRLTAIEPASLSPDQRITYELFKFDLQQAKAGERFPTELLPLNQFYNEYSQFAQLGSGQSAQPFATVADYDAFLRKIDGFVENSTYNIALMKQGIAKGVVLPKVLAEAIVPQLAAHLVSTPEASIFWGPITAMPDSFSAEDNTRLSTAWRAAIQDKLLPTYQTVHDFLIKEYIPAARSSHGWNALPDGAAWYTWLVTQSTTIAGQSPEQIHQLGLQKVAEIHAEMRKVQQQLGIKGDLQAFFKFLKNDPNQFFKTPEEALQAFRDLKTSIDAKLPQYFEVLPKQDYEVRATEAFRAANSAAGEYSAGTPDGSRKGIFYANVYNLKVQPKYGITTLSLHEAAPGHHFQIALQLEQADLPKYRQFAGYNAYAEGWALYAETLGKDMQLFNDPYQYYGHLSDALLRAMRLVVDTGLHAKGWTREQAIAYMRDNSSMPDDDVRSEVERYMVIPGQALSYMIGRLTIERLRDEARTALGPRFDIRAFHREVLRIGAVPMAVLEQHIRDWVARQQAAPAA
ncbi:DUF885 domain-containing protein [Permianibacter sp. IMCC34836]|uniref:DUF885 domain-containing protein n=1 Tax=Permianibacter fluminis TaxID=2738515 RepID=UPI00155686BC|nr:DUF885 domain-containing protein [Permianibacter fluminis]NQD35850.1 DUF885 domain-containing protein [Permianibacter fluminis]